MDLRIFVEPQQGASFDDQLTVARASEELGFDAFFRSDHYLAMGGSDGLPGPTDTWLTLAGIALRTSRIRLGTLVTSATFRLPGPLAVAVAQADAMSGGRIEFGLGAGWFAEEHEAYGIPFPDVRERFDRLEEQLEIITGLWRTPVGERFSFSGKQYRVDDSPGLPKPATPSGPPVIIGGFGKRRTPALAARFADEFNVAFAPVDTTAEQYHRVRRACSTAGRQDPPLMSAAQVLCCGRDETEISRRAAAIGREPAELRENGLAGTPDELIAKIEDFAAIGTRRIYLQVLDLHDLEHLELVAREVLPQV